jgi:hypothetical protein
VAGPVRAIARGLDHPDSILFKVCAAKAFKKNEACLDSSISGGDLGYSSIASARAAGKVTLESIQL